MRAAAIIPKISRESLKQIFIQELLQKGITKSKDGTRIELLDYHSLRYELTMARFRETNVECAESKWF